MYNLRPQFTIFWGIVGLSSPGKPRLAREKRWAVIQSRHFLLLVAFAVTICTERDVKLVHYRRKCRVKYDQIKELLASGRRPEKQRQEATPNWRTRIRRQYVVSLAKRVTQRISLIRWITFKVATDLCLVGLSP